MVTLSFIQQLHRETHTYRKRKYCHLQHVSNISPPLSPNLTSSFKGNVLNGFSGFDSSTIQATWSHALTCNNLFRTRNPVLYICIQLCTNLTITRIVSINRWPIMMKSWFEVAIRCVRSMFQADTSIQHSQPCVVIFKTWSKRVHATVRARRTFHIFQNQINTWSHLANTSDKGVNQAEVADMSFNSTTGYFQVLPIVFTNTECQLKERKGLNGVTSCCAKHDTKHDSTTRSTKSNQQLLDTICMCQGHYLLSRDILFSHSCINLQR